jgi:hypothetical protein
MAMRSLGSNAPAVAARPSCPNRLSILLSLPGEPCLPSGCAGHIGWAVLATCHAPRASLPASETHTPLVHCVQRLQTSSILSHRGPEGQRTCVARSNATACEPCPSRQSTVTAKHPVSPPALQCKRKRRESKKLRKPVNGIVSKELHVSSDV